MSALPPVNDARDRAGRMLATALGPDVRAWLAERGVYPAFELGEGRHIGFGRDLVDAVLSRVA